VNGSGLSQAAIGRALGLSPPAITKLKKQGMPVDSVESAAEWRRRHLNVAQRTPEPEIVVRAEPRTQPDEPERWDDDSNETRDEARRRREIAEADLAQLKVRQQTGELVPAAAVRAEFARQFSAVSQAMLTLAARMAPVLAAETDVGRVQTTLDAEIRNALNQSAEADI
jgi:phage terminase Nu1 subunit (DNA packaging protein)